MQAIILSIGSELVSGLRLDTHAADIARALGSVGVDVVRHETLDDAPDSIAAALKRAAADADVVLATGGLGPTPDDRTRDGLAQAMGVPLEPHPAARAALEAWGGRRGRAPSPSNLRQADLPHGAVPLANPVGSAPGIEAPLDGARVFCLPGVPVEMGRMLEGEVLPRLAAAGAECVRLVRTVRTIGLPESAIGERLADLMALGRRPRVATAVHAGLIDVHVHAAGPRGEVERLLAADAATIGERLGAAAFGEGETSLEEVVARLLAERHRTVAVAESCTGGLVAARLVNVPGMSEWLIEGVVVYSNAAKVRALGVSDELIASEGAVTEAVARAMAEGVCVRTGADVGVSVTGIAGPDGGTPEKPVGTVCFGVAIGAETTTARRVFSGDRGEVRERAANCALNLLRLRLQGGC